jgi:hypothetical protein
VITDNLDNLNNSITGGKRGGNRHFSLPVTVAFLETIGFDPMVTEVIGIRGDGSSMKPLGQRDLAVAAASNLSPI